MDGIAHSNKRSGVVFTRLRNLFWRIISPLPDRPFLCLKYASIYGRFPDLNHPTRFSELQQLRKLSDRDPLYPVIVDKARVKEFFRERTGPEFVIPTYWVGTDLDTVDWTSIPLPAVVKPTHASGAGYFLNSREDIDELMANRPEGDWLAQDHSTFNREWAYRDVPRQIIIEKMLGRPGEVLADYRFYCFNGRTVHIEIRQPVDGRMYEAIYSPDWERLELHTDYYPVLPGNLPRPDNLEKMLETVSRIGEGIHFARIDLYNTGEGLFAGEVTLYPSGGFETFVPDSYDVDLAQHWTG
jgi:hypothetical protein